MIGRPTVAPEIAQIYTARSQLGWPRFATLLGRSTIGDSSAKSTFLVLPKTLKAWLQPTGTFGSLKG